MRPNYKGSDKHCLLPDWNANGQPKLNSEYNTIITDNEYNIIKTNNDLNNK